MTSQTGLSVPALRPSDAAIAAAVEDGIRRYIASRRQRVPAFVARHFGLRGSLAVHRRAFGWDLLRAPANLLLMGPQAAVTAAAFLARRLGRRRAAGWLARRTLLLHTDVAREVEWRVLTELLELPCRQRGRATGRDALAETILSDPRLAGMAAARLRALGRPARDPGFRDRLAAAMRTYVATRAAAAEITTSALMLGSGALVVRQVTPGAVTLGAALAALIARQSAIASFPLGTALGRLWYALFPVVPPAALVGGLIAVLVVAASCLAAFAGVVMDPLQRRLGLHRRRLHRLLDALERQMLDPAAPAFAVRDHYVVRVLDVFDLLGSAYRLAH